MITENELAWTHKLGKIICLFSISILSVILFFTIHLVSESTQLVYLLVVIGVAGGLIIDYSLTYLGFSEVVRMGASAWLISILTVVGFISGYYLESNNSIDVGAGYAVETLLCSGFGIIIANMLSAPMILGLFLSTNDLGGPSNGMICFKIPDELNRYDEKRLEKRIIKIIYKNAGYRTWQQPPRWRKTGDEGVKASNLLDFNAFFWFKGREGGILVAPRAGLLTRFDKAIDIREEISLDLQSQYGIIEDESKRASDKLIAAYNRLSAPTLEIVLLKKDTIRDFIHRRWMWIVGLIVTGLFVGMFIFYPNESINFISNQGFGNIITILLFFAGLWIGNRKKGNDKASEN